MNLDMGARLQARKHDLYHAIRTLDRDHSDGSIDADSYRTTRERYEREAASILERLDALDAAPYSGVPSMVLPARRRLIMAATGGVVLVAIALFLVGAVRARTGTAAITGDVGATGAAMNRTADSPVLTAQARVRAHPRDLSAQLDLASAYVDAGNLATANSTYLHAIALAPNRPEARTMYAMFQGSDGHVRRALAQLAGVERSHPAYSKAWLVDGLLSSRLRAGLPRAIRAWRRFLALSPRASVAPQVRSLLAGAQRAARKGS